MHLFVKVFNKRGFVLSCSMMFGMAILLPSLKNVTRADSSIVVPAATSILTIDSATEEGLARSPEIQRARSKVEEERARRSQALGEGFLPKVSVSALHFFSNKYEFTDLSFGASVMSFPGIYPNTQASLNASVPIFGGMTGFQKLESATKNVDATQQLYAQAKFQLSQDIRLAFYQAVAAIALEGVADQNVTTLEDHLKQVQIQKKGGAATAYDTLRIEVQLNEARSDALDAKDNVVLTRQRLTQLLGLDHDDRALNGNLPVPDSRRVEKLDFSSFSQDRSDIQSLELRAQAAELEGRALGGWLIPRIDINGQLSLYNKLFYDGSQVIDNSNYMTSYNVGIYLSWNLFDAGVSAARAHQAAEKTIQADQAVQSVRLQVPYDFSQWKRRYMSSASRYQAKQSDVERSLESVRLAKEEARAGTRTNTEVLDAELDLFRSKAGVVNSQLSAAESLIRLELAAGRKI